MCVPVCLYHTHTPGVQFKSQYEEKMFRSMQKVLVDQKKKKKNKSKSSSSEAKSSAHMSSLAVSGSGSGERERQKKETFNRLSAVKKQDSSLFYIQNESGRKYASFNGACVCGVV